MVETTYAGAQAASRHRTPSPRADFTISQDWSAYGAEEHDIWRTLFHRQQAVLKGRACE
jgi:phenylalanine-4-hydroxylase